MPVETTVLVVGGGATGAGIARDLALRGVDVTLVDRGGLASGTTGRSHGLLHSGARYADSDPAGAEACRQESEVIRSIAGACLRDDGGLFVQLRGDDPAYFEQKVQACEAVGIPTTTIDGATARDRVPGLSAAVDRALTVPDATVYPSRLVAATAADAAAHGATIHPHAPVEAFTVADGAIVGAHLGGSVDATVEPTYVVNAAGPWAGTVASLAGVTVPMAPTRGVMVAVEYDRLGPVLNRCRPPADGDIIVPHSTEVVLGTTSVPVDDPEEYPKENWELKRTVSECAAMLPAVADAAVTRTWWGVRPLYAPTTADDDGRDISRGHAVLEHTTDGIANFLSVVGGKLTTHRLMAEEATDLLCEHLGVSAGCRTADRRLPAVDDPTRLDALVDTYDGTSPTDQDVLGTH